VELFSKLVSRADEKFCGVLRITLKNFVEMRDHIVVESLRVGEVGPADAGGLFPGNE
jgi:hypothetical protein